MMWTSLADRTPGQQVACCQGCAETHEPVAVPTKHDWCEAERKRHPRLGGPTYTLHESVTIADQVAKRRRTTFTA